MLLHSFALSFTLLCLHLLLSNTLEPSSFDFPTLDLTTFEDITQNITLNNLPGDTYQVIKTSDYYISRKSTYGKVEIFNIVDKSMKYNLFSNNQYPLSLNVSTYDIPDDSNTSLAVVFTDNSSYIYQL
jgi:hypothetical protein